MFSSRPPFREVVRWDGQVVDSGLTREGAEGAVAYWTGSHVRRQAQHNPTNRILLTARKAQAAGHLADFCEGFTETPNTEHAEIDHAQKVLTRLANLTNDKEN